MARPFFRRLSRVNVRALCKGLQGKLPAGRELAEEWEVGYSTINDAMKLLAARGVLVATMGKGTFVAERR